MTDDDEWVDGEIVSDDEYERLKAQRLAEDIALARLSVLDDFAAMFSEDERGFAAAHAREMRLSREKWVRRSTWNIWWCVAWFSFAVAWGVHDVLIMSWWWAALQAVLAIGQLVALRLFVKNRRRWKEMLADG